MQISKWMSFLSFVIVESWTPTFVEAGMAQMPRYCTFFFSTLLDELLMFSLINFGKLVTSEKFFTLSKFV